MYFQEEIDRLRAELAWVREANNKHMLLRSEAFEENHQLRAEVDRLTKRDCNKDGLSWED